MIDRNLCWQLGCTQPALYVTADAAMVALCQDHAATWAERCVLVPIEARIAYSRYIPRNLPRPPKV